MKICRRYTLSIIFLIAFTDLNAQMNVNAVFGLNLSTMSIKNAGVNINSKILAGIHYGGLFEFPVSDNFSIQPAVLFSSKGLMYDIDSLHYYLAPIYIEVPVMAIFSFGSDKIRLSFYTGPYFACAVGGTKIDPGAEAKGVSYGSGENKDMKALDMGLDLGVGINIRGILLTAQYGLGLLNLSPVGSADSEMKNKVVGISFKTAFSRK